MNVLSAVTHAIEVVDRHPLAEIAGFDGRYLNISKLAAKWALQIGRDAQLDDLLKSEEGC
jgi:hypothetical protein